MATEGQSSVMSTVDKQRIAAVTKLEQLGYTFAGDDWMHPANDAAAIAPTITDELHAMLVKRAGVRSRPLAHRQDHRWQGLANSKA